MKATTTVLCVCVLALLVAAAYAGPLDDLTKGVQDATSKVSGAAKSVTDTIDKGVNGTKNAVNSVTNGTKAAKDAVENVGKTITGKNAAGLAAPSTFKVFAAAGCGSMLLMLLAL